MTAEHTKRLRTEIVPVVQLTYEGTTATVVVVSVRPNVTVVHGLTVTNARRNDCDAWPTAVHPTKDTSLTDLPLVMIQVVR